MQMPAWTRRSPPRSLASLAAALLYVMAGSGPALAAPVDRQLEIKISVSGNQDWRNALEWSKGSTRQRYEFTTALRSDGRLEGANLLDPDTETRFAIKTEYLRREGVRKLQAAGIDPKSPDLMKDLSAKVQMASFTCKGDPVCVANSRIKFAEMMAAAVEPDNSVLFEGEPRYQFFFGYPGCTNTIRAANQYEARGETANGREKDKVSPFALSWSGDWAGSELHRQSLCTYFTVVLDTKEQKIYVENVHIPEARGKVTRTEFGRTQTEEGELLMPAPLQGWVNETLRHTRLSGESKTVLPLTLPLDGNSTVLGDFTGELSVQLEWAFK